MKIAFSGIFDIANYGDHLFPLVFEKKLMDMGVDCELFLFSCFECKQALGMNKQVYALKDLEEKHLEIGFDAIVVAGGWIAHFILISQKLSRLDREFIDYSIFEAWITPSLVALKHNIKLIWNAPDTWYEFSSIFQELMRGLCSSVDYISVRSKFSVDVLSKSGIDPDRLNISLDTAFLLPEVFGKDELIPIRKDIIPFGDKYIVYHANRNLPESEINTVVEILDFLVEQSYQVVLLPLAYTHDDESILRKINEVGNGKYYLFDRELTLREQISVLACCEMYIGVSFHGAVTAFAYNIPAIAFDSHQQKKNYEIFERFNAAQYFVTDGQMLSEVVKSALLHYNVDFKYVQFQISQINKHFENICKCLTSPIKDKGISEFASAFNNAIKHLHKSDIQAKDEHIRMMSEALGAKDKHINMLNEAIELKDGHIGRLDEALAARDEHMRILNEALGYKDEHIGMLDEAIRYKDGHIRVLDEAIVTKDGHIRMLDEAMVAKDGHIRMLDEAMVAKDGHIKMLDEAIVAKDEHIRMLDEEMMVKDKRLEDFEKNNAFQIESMLQLEKEVSQYKHMIFAMENSKSWKITSLLRKVMALFRGGK